MINLTVGDVWFSSAWSNGKSRTFANSPVDPYDNRFLTGRLAAPQLSIDGKGTLTITASTRMFVKGSWLNTDTSVYLYVPNATSGVISLRSRSNHETKCRFGNYVIIYDSDEVKTRKEPVHPIYVGNVSIKGWIFPKDKWLGIRAICRNMNNNTAILNQGFVDLNDGKGWVKMTEYTDTGNWPGTPAKGSELYNKASACISNDIDGIMANMKKPYMGRGDHCWIRCDVDGTVKFNNFSVREIPPLP